MRVPALHTARLLIRELTPADEESVRAVNDRLAPGWVAWTAETYGQLEALMQPPYGERAITLRDTGELIGLVGLVPSYGPFDQIPGLGAATRPARFRPEMGLYWGLAPAHRGNGYATEAGRALIDHALGELELARIVATTERSNTASQAVMRRLGMRVEENPLPEPGWFQVVGWLDAPESAS
ncbi:MAG TPA: GNAT family N-acetyltransferase [Gaiellales bacterium]|nr:GNAT family N-acetyltransferase [Gaiellales bacterium]